jgi:rfaE bifunctional protein nucleotidyltransferase chain/domain
VTSGAKIVTDPGALAARVAALPRPVVFTNGCFDILHRGHVAYLEQAAALGKSLVVGVNTDASVKRLEKDANRPINPLEDRLAILAALGCVSLVVAFDEDTPLELIKQVKPDHLVKGGDWTPDKIVGADLVRARGGQVHSLPFRFQRSTTDLVRRIRSSNDDD